MDFLKGLNAPQRDAVAHTEGPLLILAGAGSGKTRVITHRIAHIISTKRVPPWSVLAVTFTNKAANEMRERVGGLLEGISLQSSPNISTFHSFCVRLLRRDGEPLARVRPGFTRQFTIYDDDDQIGIVKSAYRALGLDEKEFLQYRAVLSRISHAKSHNQSPEEIYGLATSHEAERVAAIYEHYEKTLRNANALDFDDLLLEAVRLLHTDQATRENWNRRLSYVMVDEYQDTNRSQYELMRLLTEPQRNICVVGDEDQSIYSWRGADIRNILDFERDFPNARTIRLEQNYRSTKNILAAAGAVVENNKARKGKTLWTEAESGPLIGMYAAADAGAEAVFIADQIEKYLASHRKENVAVLYRTNFQSRQIEEALRRRGRRYNVVGGFSFYQRAEVKDIVAYLKMTLSPSDPVSLLRVINTPARGIGRTTVDQIEKYARERGLSLWEAIGGILEDQSLSTRSQTALAAFRNLMLELSDASGTATMSNLMRLILDRTGYRRMLEEDKNPDAETRLENLDELLNAAVEAEQRGEKLLDFLDHAALVAEQDSYDATAPVTLMTLHNAKGLEFPMVILCGLEMGLFPHSRSRNSEEGMEEERRLCYVGMTRAERRLILTWAKYRRRFGGGEQERSAPSLFLNEVPEHLMENLGPVERADEVDLYAERWDARQMARRNTFTGKTYNSLENISQFFNERGMPAQKPAPPGNPQLPRPPLPAKPLPNAPPPAARAARTGMTVEHPKYGRGTVVRREGDGDGAKITVNFQRFGLKKIVEKYAILKRS